MCAISGMINLPASEKTVRRMLETMHRRGPDDRGVYREKGCTLLHGRLAIIDPEGGRQPMTLAWAGEEYALVYNGELYNTEQLRSELSALGHSFLGHSDTEVLLHAYAQFGAACVEKLNGIFAFAVWEKHRGRLFLARDRIGVKPLFYKLRLCRYWKLMDREHRDSFDETVEKVRFLVTDAIRRQMVSDVPIGTFLSGGLDSSIITAVCAGEMAQRGERLKTFSVDYQNNDKYFQANKFQPNSDSSYIRLMTDALQTDHHWTILGADELAQTLEEATIARDLPGMADVDFSLLAFCREIRQKVKVALSGECADEIFGGYPWYRDPEVRAREGFPWAQNTMDRAAILTPAITLDPAEFVMDAYNRTCRESDILPGTSDQERRMKQMVNLNFRWFMQTLLDRKDRMSMYHSLEVRVPFCDYRIAEYLYGVPWEFKDYQGQEKGLLRRAVEGLLPEPVLHRKKSPYPKTFDPRYEQLMETRLQTILDDPAAPLWQLVSAEEVKKLLHRETQWPWYGQLMRRPQTIAYLCQIDFWLRHYSVELVF